MKITMLIARYVYGFTEELASGKENTKILPISDHQSLREVIGTQ